MHTTCSGSLGTKAQLIVKFVAQYLREIPGQFKLKDGETRHWVDFQFMDVSRPPADGLEELVRFRVDAAEADMVRKRLTASHTYDLVINRLGWDKTPIVYRGRIGEEVKA